MIFNCKNLIGLKVVTVDGRYLGQIKDIEIDVLNGKIIEYIISPSQLVQKILANDLVVNQSQVIEITNQEMVVDSNLAGGTEAAGEFAV